MTEPILTPVVGFIFGGIPESIFGLVLYIWVSIWASGRVLKGTNGPATPLWLAFIWLAPCLGGILALVAVKKEGPTTIEVRQNGE